MWGCACDCIVCVCAAITNLNGVDVYGKSIHVTLSKHPQVQMPQAGSNVSAHTHTHTKYRFMHVHIHSSCAWTPLPSNQSFDKQISSQ